MPIDHNRITKFWLPAAEIVLGATVLAVLTYVGLRLDLNRPATASLAYLIVIVLLSLRGSLIPAVVLSVIAAVCLEYFFAEPRFSMRIEAPEDVLAVAAFVITSIVITGLVRRARRLDEAAALRDRLQVIIDTIPAMVWSNLPDGSTEFLNKRFRDYAGITSEQGQGSAWMNIVHPDDRAGIDWHGALAAGGPFEKEARLRSSDGEYRRFLLRFVPLLDPQGSIEKWYAKSVDIEDLRRAEEELRLRETRLRDAQMALAHANRVTTIGQLAASIAHEVSQPIAAAITNANAARRWLTPSRPIWRRSGRPLAASFGTADEPATSSAGSARSSGRRRRGRTRWTSTRWCAKSSR
jgi:PAS domain S-box-containing protein